MVLSWIWPSVRLTARARAGVARLWWMGSGRDGGGSFVGGLSLPLRGEHPSPVRFPVGRTGVTQALRSESGTTPDCFIDTPDRGVSNRGRLDAGPDRGLIGRGCCCGCPSPIAPYCRSRCNAIQRSGQTYLSVCRGNFRVHPGNVGRFIRPSLRDWGLFSARFPATGTHRRWVRWASLGCPSGTKTADICRMHPFRESSFCSALRAHGL
jgi:hypothetical protein